MKRRLAPTQVTTEDIFPLKRYYSWDGFHGDIIFA